VAAALLVPAFAAAAELRLPPVHRATFPNGMRVVVVEDHELPLMDITVFVGAGVAQDPADRLGLAELTADSLLRGAGRYSAPALARAIEDLGGTIEAAAGYDATIVSADFLADDVAAGIELLRLVLREPRLDRAEVRRARDELAAELVADLEDPSAVANQCLAAFLYAAHPYGRPPKGARSTVGGLGHREVRRFYERWYRPNNVILTLVGDVRAEMAIDRLRRAFGDWQPRTDAGPVRSAPPGPVAAPRVLLVDKPDATQSQIRFGGVALPRAARELLTAQVGNTILGGGFSSILIDELRVKRSLTYGAFSGYVPRLTGGDFRVSTSTKTETTLPALALALEVVDRFRGSPPQPNALAKAKTFTVGQFVRQIETANALGLRLAEIEFFGLPQNELATYVGRTEALTAPAVHQVVSRHQPPSSEMAIVVLGQAAKLRQPLEAKYGAVRVVRPEECERLHAGE
jgi:zinc protease